MTEASAIYDTIKDNWGNGGYSGDTPSITTTETVGRKDTATDVIEVRHFTLGEIQDPFNDDYVDKHYRLAVRVSSKTSAAQLKLLLDEAEWLLRNTTMTDLEFKKATKEYGKSSRKYNVHVCDMWVEVVSWMQDGATAPAGGSTTEWTVDTLTVNTDLLGSPTAALGAITGNSTLNLAGALTGSSTGQFTKMGIGQAPDATALLASPNADSYYLLGRAALGYDGTNADHAIFGHRDNRSGTNYALKDISGGATIVNAPTGQEVRIAINNAQQVSHSATESDFGGNDITTTGDMTSGDGAVLGKQTTYTHIKWCSAGEMYHDGSNGSLGGLDDSCAAVAARNIVKDVGNICGWITASIFIEDPKTTTSTMKLWFVRDDVEAAADTITIRYYVSFQKAGSAQAYNIHSNQTTTQELTNDEKIVTKEITLTDADISAQGVMSIFLKFEDLDDDTNYFMGISMESVEDHNA